MNTLNLNEYSVAQRCMAITLLSVAFGCSAATPVTNDESDAIIPGDPRFNVFELSNSAGDSTFASPEGTVYLSFATKDSRYCRAARFDKDRTAILACRNEHGWKIEATSPFQPNGKGNTLSVGAVTPAINDAVSRLNPKLQFLHEREIIEAAKKDWR